MFPSATKCLVEGDQLDACHSLGDDVLGFEFKLLSLGIQDVEKVRQPSFGRALISLFGRSICARQRQIPTDGLTLCNAIRFVEVRTATRRQINGSMSLISMRRVAVASVGETVIRLICTGFDRNSRRTT